jgi:ABC-type sugar transport system substrate-binding protein
MVRRLEMKNGAAKGKVIILQGLPGFHTTERTTGFLAGIDTAAHKGVVIEMYPAKWRRDEAKVVVERLLTTYKNIGGIFGCSDAMAQGAAQAAIEAKVDLVSIGIDGNPDMIDDIRNGTVTATLAVFPKEIGRQTIRTIDTLLKGGKVEEFVKTPIMVVSKDNLEEYLKKL